jgi:lipopolysaccharide exporter
MTTFQMASKGVSWMLGTQIIIGAGQFVYSAITARAFTPAEFGSCSAALGRLARRVLVTTTGLPSVVLREHSLSRTDVSWIRVYAIVGGIFAAILFILIAPLWIQLLRAPDASQFLPLLAVSLTLGPLAAVEASLLRRESRPMADAASFLLAFLLPAIVAITATVYIRQAWVLALATILAPITLGLSSALLRREKFLESGSARHASLLGFSGKVSLQNIVFLLIGSIQGWVLSATLGAAALGQYTRATTLANTPATAFSTALNRAIQPHWRKLNGESTTARAILDTTLLTSSLSFPVFALIAVVGPEFTPVWLGQGWDEVARLIPWLAAAGGLSVTFGILVTSLEMRELFHSVRMGQIGLAVGVAIGLTIFAFTKNIEAAGAGVLIAHALGLIALLSSMASSSHVSFRSLVWAATLPALWAVGVALVAFIAVSLCQVLEWKLLGNSNLMSLVTGTFAAAAFWTATFRWQPASRILQLRGVRLPRVLSAKEQKE